MKKTMSLFAIIFLFLGCSNAEALLFTSIPETGWTQQDWVRFSYTNRLPAKKVKASWKLRHDNDYPYANIYLIAQYTTPTGISKTDTLTYLMAQPDGSWLGTGWYIKEIDLPYVASLDLDEPGQYHFQLRPVVRANDNLLPDKRLLGIHQVGLELISINDGI